MTMTDALRLALALVTGLLLGAIFFGGLWWTVRRGFSSKQPALWFFGSLLLRTSIALAGFYFIARGHWEVPDSRHLRPDAAVAAFELLGEQKEIAGHFAPDRLP
jgi:F1F0 ATPase subunit 2